MMPTEFFSSVGRFLALVEGDLAVFVGVLIRMSAIAFLAPGLGEQAVPVRVRLAAALAFTIVAFPPIASPDLPSASLGEIARLFGAEAMAGLLLGFSFRIAIFIFHTAGTIIAQSLSMSQLFGPGIGHEQESPISTILIMAGLAALSSSGFLIEVAATAAASYEALPFGSFMSTSDATDHAAGASGAALSFAFALSAPFVLLGFIYTIALSAMSRAMPQLMATFIGAPAILFAGMVLIASASSIVLSRWIGVAEGIISNPFGQFQ
jgi:flagellar biosynthetic protein FliR